MNLSVQEAETIIKILTPVYCPITKASNNSHFHYSNFFALYFPSQHQWFFLSLLSFLILEIKNNCVQSDRTMCRPLNKVEPFFCGIRTWMGDQKRIPRVVITLFFFLFPFEDDIKDCRTPQPCVMSLLSISQLFVCHFAMSAFACIFTISYNRTDKQPDPSFEFFSVILTFDCLKQ